MDQPPELIVLDIEEGIPLPETARDAMPELTSSEELNMRARTIKLLSDLSGSPLIPNEDNSQDAEVLARSMMENPELKPDFSSYPDETIAYLAGLVARSNQSLVKDLSEYKNYIIMKLVELIESPDSQKNKLVALSKLGEIDGVDAFKRRSEITHKIVPIEEVEQELLKTLSELEFKQIQEAPMNFLKIPSESPVEGANSG